MGRILRAVTLGYSTHVKLFTQIERRGITLVLLANYFVLFAIELFNRNLRHKLILIRPDHIIIYKECTLELLIPFSLLPLIMMANSEAIFVCEIIRNGHFDPGNTILWFHNLFQHACPDWLFMRP